LSSDNASVLVEVWDADPEPPAPKDLTEDGRPDLQEEGGRGLFLVAALSSRWIGTAPESHPARSSGANWKPDPHSRHYYVGFEIASEPYERRRARRWRTQASVASSGEDQAQGSPRYGYYTVEV
jgi:hypothetical protein